MRGAALAVLALVACSSEPPVSAGVPYESTFDTLGPEWQSTSGRWTIDGGRLLNDGAHNVPLWLAAKLPNDVRIAFTVESKSPEVDFKCELFGDGKRHESGYIVIFGGWKNSTSLIARMDEHGPRRTPAVDAQVRAEAAENAVRAAAVHEDRKDAVARSVSLESNRAYRVEIERRGNLLRSYLDGELHLEYFDPSPLAGRGHDRFAFSNWASTLYFDDLSIRPVEP